MRTGVLFAIFGLFAGLGQAGVIVGHNPTVNNRFTGGFPAAPIANTSSSFLGAPFDLSGVGWIDSSPQFAITMITPQHFLAAAHVGTGTSVSFLGSNGVVNSYSVASSFKLSTTFVNTSGNSQTLDSDILIGTLAAPIPTTNGVKHYSVAGLDPAQVAGTNLLAYGQNPNYGTSPHLGTNTALGVSLTSFSNFANEATHVIAYDFTPGITNEIYLIGGDSGGPLFTVHNNELLLIGGHYGVSNATLMPNDGDISASTFLPMYTSQLNQQLSGSSYQVTVVPVPEPASIVAIALVAGVGVWFRRRLRYSSS
jgi:hypothetical protein